MISRKERLTTELREAELKLDGIGRVKEPGLMRTQQALAGQRARVLGLRAELVQIEFDGVTGRTEKNLILLAELRAQRTDLLMRVKDAELSARAASKQATEDELPDLVKRLNAADAMGEKIVALH